MTEAFGGRPFPRGVLIAVAILLGFVILMVATARILGIKPDQAPLGAVLEARDIRFVDLADGSLAVYDAGTSVLIDTLPPGGEGFVRGVLRSMARQRKSYQVDPAQPFRLARRDNGGLTLEDQGTGIVIELKAFGQTNEAAFARLMETPPPAQSPQSQ